MTGCNGCKFNLGPAPQVGVKCSSPDKVKAADRALNQTRFERYFNIHGHIIVFEKKVCDFGELKA